MEYGCGLWMTRRERGSGRPLNLAYTDNQYSVLEYDSDA